MSESINFTPVDRYWFLTWTTYGTWLPGDARGFVGSLRDQSGEVVEHNKPGTPVARPESRLREASERSLKGNPVVLIVDQADELLAQLQETARFVAGCSSQSALCERISTLW